MYFRCCCSITNARFLSLYINYIKSIWTTRTNLRLDRVTDRANSQTMSSYPVRFSADILFLLSSIIAFAFVFLFVWVLFFFFEIKNIYSDTHSTMRVDELSKKFTRPISRNKTSFLFGLIWIQKFGSLYLKIWKELTHWPISKNK